MLTFAIHCQVLSYAPDIAACITAQGQAATPPAAPRITGPSSQCHHCFGSEELELPVTKPTGGPGKSRGADLLSESPPVSQAHQHPLLP